MLSWLKDGKKKRWFVFFCVFAGFVVLEIFLYVRLISVRSEAAGEPESVAPRSARVMIPVPSAGTVYSEVLGKVMGRSEVDVRADVKGTVKSVGSPRGSEVEKGEIILVLYDYRVQARSEEARYNLLSARESLRETERIYERNKVLFEKGIVSADTAEASLNALRSASAAVKSLENSYGRAKWEYESLMVRSPIRGRVVEVAHDVGQEVAAGEVVARVVNLDGRKVIAAVDVSVARLVEPGDTLELFLDSDGGKEASGEVVGVSRDSGELSGLYEMEISVRGPEAPWWPGEVVYVKVPVKKFREAVEIPRAAVVSEGGGDFVLVERNSEVSMIPVTVTWMDDKAGYVSFDSIPEGSRIIVEGNLGLRPGQRVRVVD